MTNCNIFLIFYIFVQQQRKNPADFHSFYPQNEFFQKILNFFYKDIAKYIEICYYIFVRQPRCSSRDKKRLKKSIFQEESTNGTQESVPYRLT